jgi:lipopolysaccharide transport system permease protein
MATTEVVLKPRKGWQPIDFEEIWRGRELFGILVWRDITIRYKQTLLGGLWAVLQPLLAMLIFTIFFNRLGGIRSDGIPYPLFAYSGLVLWTFFSNAVSISSNSLVGNQALVSKVYFPRIFIPLAGIVALVLDLFIGLVLLIVMTLYYLHGLSWTFLFVPVFAFGALLAASGFGLFLSALNVSFRDVKYAVPFFVQMGLFVSPVIYPLSSVPPRYHIPLAIVNPMVGLISGFRRVALGERSEPLLTWVSFGMSVLVFVVGLLVFRSTERRFADVI